MDNSEQSAQINKHMQNTIQFAQYKQIISA